MHVILCNNGDWIKWIIFLPQNWRFHIPKDNISLSYLHDRKFIHFCSIFLLRLLTFYITCTFHKLFHSIFVSYKFCLQTIHLAMVVRNKWSLTTGDAKQIIADLFCQPFSCVILLTNWCLYRAIAVLWFYWCLSVGLAGFVINSTLSF